MTFPAPPTPPATIGAQPQSAAEVNSLVGTRMREFLALKERIAQTQEFLAVTDLKGAPYYYSDQQEAVIKSGVGDLNNGLGQVPLAFISQLAGM